MKHKFKFFSTKLSNGLKQEYYETKEIPENIKRGNFKEVIRQIVDIIKILFIAFVLILPAGVIISVFIFKFFKQMRPSAFKASSKKSD